MPTLYICRFRTINPITKKWLTARLAAEYPVLNRHFEEFEIIGAPEVRQVSDDWRALTAGHLAQGVPIRQDYGTTIRRFGRV